MANMTTEISFNLSLSAQETATGKRWQIAARGRAEPGRTRAPAAAVHTPPGRIGGVCALRLGGGLDSNAARAGAA